MTLEEARRILAEADDSDTARSLQAVAMVLRFHGIADKQLLPIAASLEEAAASLDSEPSD